MSLINQVIDFSDDAGKALLKDIAATAPEFVKTAVAMTPKARDLLDPEQFALVMRTKEAQELRKFPITDKASTWLSCAYFQKTAEQLPYVAQKVAATNLRRACSLYGIEVPELISKTASDSVTTNRYDEVLSRHEDRQKVQMEKTASDGSKHFYALGERYPMPSNEFVKKAAAYFQHYHREFGSAEDRHEFAANVLARAKELNVELEDVSLRKYASNVYGDSVKQHLRIRAEYAARNPEYAEAYVKLASKIDDVDAETFAKTLSLLDKKAGMDRYYDSKISDAFSATFGNTFEKQAGYRWEDESSGLSIDGKELKKMAEQKHDRVKALFGTTLADEMKKHAVEIFESLPKDAKETIVRLAKGEL